MVLLSRHVRVFKFPKTAMLYVLLGVIKSGLPGILLGGIFVFVMSEILR